MKNLLTFLWIIIIVGTVFISIKLFKPDTSEEDLPPPQEEEIEEPVEIEEAEPEEEPEEEPEPEVSKSYNDYINDGDLYFSQGYLEKAINNYENASKLNPKSTTPLIKLASTALLNNDPKLALLNFKKAEELDPDSLEIKIGIAKSFLNDRNIEAAKNVVWELDINEPIIKYYTGIILILYKDFEGSRNTFQELVSAGSGELTETELKLPIPENIIENSQKFLDAYTNFSYFKEAEQIFLQTLLAKALTDVGEFEASIPLLYDVINQKDNYRDAWIVLGYAYLNTNKILDSIDAFSQAKAFDEEKPETLFFLGLAYFANNEIDKAIHYLEEAEKNGFEPKDQVKQKLGDLYLLKENYQKAGEKYEEVLSINTHSIDLFIRAIWINIDKLNKPQKALELAKRVLELYPEDPMSYNLVGWALTAGDNYVEAKKYLVKALELNPAFDAAHLNLGWLYEKKGLTTLAKEYYKKAYFLGNGNSIANLAAVRFNNLNDQGVTDYYSQVNISAP